MKGFDCFATVKEGWPAQLYAMGYRFFARYYRRAPLEGGKGNAMWRSEAERLFKAGFWALAVYQNTSNYPSYFTIPNARLDADAAIAAASFHGQPKDTIIYFAVDCDVPPSFLSSLISYFIEVKERLWRAGYSVGVYGPGAVCKVLYAEGLVKRTWLANAKGWSGYRDWLPHATVLQTSHPFLLPFGLEIDEDRCEIDPRAAGFWRPDMSEKKASATQPPKSRESALLSLLRAFLSIFKRR